MYSENFWKYTVTPSTPRDQVPKIFDWYKTQGCLKYSCVPAKIIMIYLLLHVSWRPVLSTGMVINVFIWFFRKRLQFSHRTLWHPWDWEPFQRHSPTHIFTPYNGLYREAPPKRVPFSGFRYIKGLGLSQLEVYLHERVRKSVTML